MQIDEQKAKKLYPKADDWFKAELEEAFGQECFLKKDFRDIKTFEDACKVLEINPTEILGSNDTSDEIAYMKLKAVIRAINQGWIPDWDDSYEKKWWPYFKLSSGFGFSDTDYLCDYAFTDVGSRLCFESHEKAAYTAEQFLDLYREFLTLTK